MKKCFLVLLAAALLLISAAAYAKYDHYQVTLGDDSYLVGWTFCPLDAHNSVVIARTDKDKPWHVGWYRDGERYRDLAGYVENVYQEDMVIPKPVLWDGENLTVMYCIRKGAFRKVVINGVNVADPDNYEYCLAEWTENGLENQRPVPDDWYDAQLLGRVMFSKENGAFRLRIDGKEAALPDSLTALPAEDVFNLECFPAGEDRYLLTYVNDADHQQHMICMDHGKKRSEVAQDIYVSWLLLPDGTGGFFNETSPLSSTYDPLEFEHYTADGEKDRVLELKGNEVCVRLHETVADEQTGNVILYGTAVANSRRIYAAFAMTLDRDLNVCGLDVREIDPAYAAYSADIRTAPDGTAYLLIGDVNQNVKLRPVMIPFSELKKSGDDYGLTLE